MTYIGRKDQFQCNGCHKIEYVSNGLPKGWCYIKTGGTTEHACADCRVNLPKDKQFDAGQK